MARKPVERWLIAAAIVAVATATLWGLKQLAVKRLKAFPQRTRTQFDDLLVALLDVGTPMCRARGRLIESQGFIGTVESVGLRARPQVVEGVEVVEVIGAASSRLSTLITSTARSQGDQGAASAMTSPRSRLQP